MTATPRNLADLVGLKQEGDARLRAKLVAAADRLESPKLLSLEELMNQQPPAWFMEGLIPEDSLTVLYGPPKIGKTFLVNEWVHAMASGVSWEGHRTIPIRVLYCPAEGYRTLGERGKALRMTRGYGDIPNLAYLPASRHLYSKDKWTDPLLILVKALDEFRPHLVVLDTLSRHMPGGAVDDNADVNMVVSRIDTMREAFDTSFMLIHHTRKDNSDFLGAITLYGSADMMIQIRPHDERKFSIHVEGKDVEPRTLAENYHVVGVKDLPGWAVVESTAAGLSQKQQQVFSLIADGGPITGKELQEKLKMGKYVYQILKALEKKDLVWNDDGEWNVTTTEEAF